MWSWCQNIYSIEYLKIHFSSALTHRILRGSSSNFNFDYTAHTISDNICNFIDWRPCFELL